MDGTTRNGGLTGRHMVGMLLVAVLAVAGSGCGGAAQVGGPTAAASAASATGATEGTVPTPGGDAGAVADVAPSPAQTSGSGDAVTDGSFPAYLLEVEDSTVTVDRIEILSGEQARAARAADGEPPIEEGVDIPYLRNRSDRPRTVPTAPDVTVAVYDCSQACEHVAWDYADLVADKPLPYGTMEGPFVVTVDSGEVVEISEVYLP